MVGAVACGVRVLCWWSGDMRWFAGTLDAFDAVKYEHTVRYDDGDVQQHCLFRDMVSCPQSRQGIAVRFGDVFQVKE